MYNSNIDNNNNYCQKFTGKTLLWEFSQPFLKINVPLWKENCTAYNHFDVL